MILFLHGQDTYRSLERLGFLRRGFEEKYDKAGHSILSFEGKDMDIDDFHRSVTSQGLFTTRRFVILRNILAHGTNEAQEAVWNTLEKGIPEETILVFWEGGKGEGKNTSVTKRGGKKSTKSVSLELEKFLSTKARVEKYDPLSPQLLSTWVLNEAKKYDGSFRPDALQEFLRVTQGDMWQMHHDIVKLSNYAHGREITCSDVRDLVKVSFSEDIFGFVDAITHKDPKKSLQLFDEQLAAGANTSYVITMLFRQVRILLQIQSASAISSQPGIIAAQLKLHPFVVKKALPQMKKFSLEQLIRMHDDLYTLEMRLRSVNIPARTLLEHFLVRSAV